MMKGFLTILGGLVFFLWLIGALGIGHFYIYYGPDKIIISKENGDRNEKYYRNNN